MFFFPRQVTSGWPTTLVWAVCVLRSGSAGEKARTRTPWRPPAWRWRKPGPPTWRGFCGIRPLTVEVLTATQQCILFFIMHSPKSTVDEVLNRFKETCCECTVCYRAAHAGEGVHGHGPQTFHGHSTQWCCHLWPSRQLWAAWEK